MIRPLKDRVLVKRLENDNKSGIIIPGKKKEIPDQGTVIAVGKVDLKIGDHVLFNKYGGTEVDHDGAKALIIRECDIIGVFENE